MAVTPLTLEHEFMFEWSFYLDPDTDWANMKAFIQQNFGKGAATNLDVRSGQYEYSSLISGGSDAKRHWNLATWITSPTKDVGRWVDWLIQYKPSATDGYVKVYRGDAGQSCKLVFSVTGATMWDNFNEGYFKLGVYRHVDNVLASLWLTDFTLSKRQ